MSPLAPPDSHFLNAAQGWLGLGNPGEAAAELQRIRPRHRTHPEVLATRWQLHAERKEWKRALAVARALIKAVPQHVTGWIDQSFALHELGRTSEARASLLEVAGKFADVSTVPYNLACYACQLGDREEALAWLDKAVQLAGRAEIQRMALGDRDLQPLWRIIAEW